MLRVDNILINFKCGTHSIFFTYSFILNKNGIKYIIRRECALASVRLSRVSLNAPNGNFESVRLKSQALTLLDQNRPDTNCGHAVKGSGFPPEDLHTCLHGRVIRAVIHRLLR